MSETTDRTWYSKLIDRIPGRRKSEAVAHIASWVAVTLTALMVGSAMATETNPVSATLIETLGMREFALLTPLLLSAAYRLLGWPDGRGWDGVAAVVASAFVLDAAGNVWAVSQAGLPETALWTDVAVTSALVGTIALVCYLRMGVETGKRLKENPEPAIKATAGAALVMAAAVVPWAAFPATATATQSSGGELLEDWESGSNTFFPAGSVTEDDPIQGEYAYNYSAGSTIESEHFDAPNETVSFYWRQNSGEQVIQLENAGGSIRYNIDANIDGNQQFETRWNNIELADYEEGVWYRFRFNTQEDTLTLTNAETGEVLYDDSIGNDGDYNVEQIGILGFGGETNLDYVAVDGANPGSGGSETKDVSVIVDDRTEDNLFENPDYVRFSSQNDVTTGQFNYYNQTSVELQPNQDYSVLLRSQSGAVWEMNGALATSLWPNNVAIQPGSWLGRLTGETTSEGVNAYNIEYDRNQSYEPPDYEPPDYPDEPGYPDPEDYQPPNYTFGNWTTTDPFEPGTPTAPTPASTPTTGTGNTTNATLVDMNTTEPVEEFNYTITDGNGTVLYEGSKEFDEPTSRYTTVIPNSELDRPGGSNDSALPESANVSYSGEYSNGTDLSGTSDVSFSDATQDSGFLGPTSGSGGGGSPLIGATIIGGAGYLLYRQFGSGSITGAVRRLTGR